MSDDGAQAAANASNETPDEASSPTAADWLRCAEDWFESSRFLVEQCMHSHVCEGARHSVELALKAILIDRGHHQPAHLTSLLVLGKKISDELPLEVRSALVKLDHYYYEPLYPTDLIPRPSEYYEEPEATEALQMARELIDWTRGFLPESVLKKAPREELEAT